MLDGGLACGAAAGIRTPDHPVFSPERSPATILEGLQYSVPGVLQSHQLTTGVTQRLPGDTLASMGTLVNGPCVEVNEALLQGFYGWLLEEQGTSRKTVRDYQRYLSRLQGLSLCRKQDVSAVFERMGLTKTSYEAFSRLLTYLEKKTPHEGLALALRKALPKKPKSREDTYVPPDSLVAGMPGCLARHGEAYLLLHYLLAYTGLRFEEARWILENRDRVRAVELPYGAVRIHLPPELQRGSKRAFAAYLPAWLWEKVQAYQGPLHNKHTLKRRFRECGLAVKYYRKWWRQKGKELGVDGETLEAFQGRPRLVGGKRYTDWIPILDKEYERIMQYIAERLGLRG